MNGTHIKKLQEFVDDFKQQLDNASSIYEQNSLNNSKKVNNNRSSKSHLMTEEDIMQNNKENSRNFIVN